MSFNKEKPEYWSDQVVTKYTINDEYLKSIIKKLEEISAQMAAEELRQTEDEQIISDLNKIAETLSSTKKKSSINIKPKTGFLIYKVYTLTGARSFWDEHFDINIAHSCAHSYQKEESHPGIIYIVEEDCY